MCCLMLPWCCKCSNQVTLQTGCTTQDLSPLYATRFMHWLYLIPSTLSYILVVSQMPVMGPTYCQIEGTAVFPGQGAPGATDLEIAGPHDVATRRSLRWDLQEEPCGGVPSGNGTVDWFQGQDFKNEWQFIYSFLLPPPPPFMLLRPGACLFCLADGRSGLGTCN